MLFFNLFSYPTVTTLRMVHIQARLMDAQILNVEQDFVVRTQNMTFEKILRRKKYFLIRWILFMMILIMLQRLICFILQIVSRICEAIFDIWRVSFENICVTLWLHIYYKRNYTRYLCIYGCYLYLCNHKQPHFRLL